MPRWPSPTWAPHEPATCGRGGGGTVPTVRTAVALATCAEMPVEADEGPLVDAFERAGIPWRWAVWDDPAEDWSSFAGVLIRTTWDYHDKVDAFREWVRAVDAVTTLWNPAPVVVWNSHKRYLAELADRGVAVVPTRFVPVGTALSVADLPDDDGHGYVVKPAESVGALGLSRWSGDDAGRAATVAATEALHRDDQDALVQPLLPAVTEAGESSLVLVDGRLSHAVRKVPAAGDIRSQPEWGADLTPMTPSAAQEALAHAALDAACDRLGLAGPLLYARVDCVDHRGEPCLMELELIEPDLYVGHQDGAADRVAAAVVARLGG